MDTPFAELTQIGQARRLRVLAAEALRSYDLGGSRLRLLSNEWNCTFRVGTPDGPRALRVMRRDAHIAEYKVRSEDEFVRALVAETDIAAPRILPSASGAPYVLASSTGVPGPRGCVLYEWLPGGLLEARVTAGRMAALGTLMARLHRFAAGWTPSPAFEAVTYRSVLAYGSPLVLFGSERVDLLGLDGLLREAYEVTNERIAAIMREQPSIVVHGDLHGQNVKVHRGVLTPFDWEDLLWATPVLDVATALFYVRHRADYLELARAFRAGYEQHRPWVETRAGEVDRLLIARGLDMLNFIALDPALHFDDMEAYVRLREVPARVAVGQLEPLKI